MFNDLKTIVICCYVNKFDDEVNAWCRNKGYKIISCDTQIIGGRMTYIAFLGR